MDNFLSRNGLISLVFLGILVFSISKLVGSDEEDGLLMKAAKDFTGETGAQPVKTARPDTGASTGTGAEPMESAAAPIPGPAPVIGEFADDSTLIDNAAGFNPSPDLGSDTKPDSQRDEVMVLPESANPGVGELDENGYEVVSISDDEYE